MASRQRRYRAHHIGRLRIRAADLHDRREVRLFRRFLLEPKENGVYRAFTNVYRSEPQWST